MHIARVHDELRAKLSILGENLGVLDSGANSPHRERIVSSIAKYGGNGNENDSGDEKNVPMEEVPESPAEKLASSLLHFQSQAFYSSNALGNNLLPAPSRLPRDINPLSSAASAGRPGRARTTSSRILCPRTSSTFGPTKCRDTRKCSTAMSPTATTKASTATTSSSI
ncbi:Kelch repeat and BTB (POZ) domain containing 2 [Caligus rogercresseyi]|uniref:Kelch repeat and BTB (POZ) domain containing 2 n=1 Tax=Caligus rogercresseyi TaxID=217165 RepID=A0A7T8KJX6_CALRO|nr:Kelch repeat and BTB (POZ) domain containing 2 [Caligus rogercresseyi]